MVRSRLVSLASRDLNLAPDSQTNEHLALKVLLKEAFTLSQEVSAGDYAFHEPGLGHASEVIFPEIWCGKRRTWTYTNIDGHSAKEAFGPRADGTAG